MERQDVDQALELLHRALAVVRNLAIETGDLESTAGFLDKIEVLPQLIQQFSQDRAQNQFYAVIDELKSSHPFFAILEKSEFVEPLAR